MARQCLDGEDVQRQISFPFIACKEKIIEVKETLEEIRKYLM